MLDREAFATIGFVFILGVLITLVLFPITGIAGVFPEESIQQEGGFILEIDSIPEGVVNNVTATERDTARLNSTQMAVFELDNVTIQDNSEIGTIQGARITKNFETPSGNQLRMEISAESLDFEGSSAGHLRLWASEFHAGTLNVSSNGTSTGYRCWTTQPSNPTNSSILPGLASNPIKAQKIHFKTHSLTGQDVTINDLEINMLEGTRYTVSTHTNLTGPIEGCVSK